MCASELETWVTVSRVCRSGSDARATAGWVRGEAGLSHGQLCGRLAVSGLFAGNCVRHASDASAAWATMQRACGGAGSSCGRPYAGLVAWWFIAWATVWCSRGSGSSCGQPFGDAEASSVRGQLRVGHTVGGSVRGQLRAELAEKRSLDMGNHGVRTRAKRLLFGQPRSRRGTVHRAGNCEVDADAGRSAGRLVGGHADAVCRPGNRLVSTSRSAGHVGDDVVCVEAGLFARATA